MKRKPAGISRIGSLAQWTIALSLLGWHAAARVEPLRADEPSSAMNQYMRGMQAEREGNVEEAFDAYKDAVRTGSDLRATVGSLVRMARIQMMRRSDADAQEYIDQVLQRAPDHAEAKLMQARLWLLQDNPRKASRLFEQLAQREQVAVEAHIGLFEAAFIRADAAQIQRSRNRLMKVIGESLELRARATKSLRDDAEFFSQAARAELATALAEVYAALEPGPPGKHLLAMMRYQANQLDAAKELFAELVAVEKMRESAEMMLSQIEIRRKELQWGEKREHLKKLKEMLSLAESESRWEDALSLADQMILYGRDVSALDVSEVEQKRPYLQKRRAESVLARSKRSADEAMRAGRHFEAAQILRQARPIIGATLVTDGMLAEAILKSLMSVPPAEQESVLREVLAIENDLAAIQGALQTSIMAQTHAHLGVLLESQGRFAEAAVHYRTAVDKFSNMPDLSRRLWAARIRANLWVSLLLCVGVLLVGTLLFVRWPNLHRILMAYARWQHGMWYRRPEQEYHALTALVALLPNRTDLKRRLIQMADEKGDEDVSLYLHEQLRREASLDQAGLLRLYELYRKRKIEDKLYGLVVELLKGVLDHSTRPRILETKYGMDFLAGRFKEALSAGRELMSLRPTAELAEQMISLMRRSGEDADLKTLLLYYRVWLKFQPHAAEQIGAEAETILEKLAAQPDSEEDPAVREWVQFLFEIHIKAGNHRRAADVLEYRTRIEKDPVPVLQTLLKLYQSLSDGDALFQTTRRIHQADPKNFESGMNYADLLLKQSQNEEAEAVYLKLLSHHPNSVVLVNTLTGMAKHHFESDVPSGLDRAVSLLRSIVGTTFLDTKETRLLLVRCLMKKNQYDEAIAIAQLIEGGGYNKFRASSLLAEAFLRKHQPGLAADVLSKVNFDEPTLTDDLRKEIKYLQAEVFEAQGRLNEAVDILDELLLKDITFKDVKARHERLARVTERHASMACKSCGKPNPPGSRFCGFCGLPCEQPSAGTGH